MKEDFKKAAAKAGKALGKFSTWIVLAGAVNLSLGAAAGVTYYNSPDAKAAYETCITQKKSCTAEQLDLAEQRIKNEKNFITQLMMGSLLLSIGMSRHGEDKNAERVKELRGEIASLNAQKWEQIGKTAEESRRADAAELKLTDAQAQLAPYLADEKRKADVVADAAAKQQLNQMATDATTLQGEMKIAKKPISIKQPPQP